MGEIEESSLLMMWFTQYCLSSCAAQRIYWVRSRTGLGGGRKQSEGGGRDIPPKMMATGCL